MSKLKILSLTFLFASALNAQELQIKPLGIKCSFRGLSVVDRQVVWASGSNGVIVKTIDGGQHFSILSVEGYEKRDFRDIEAFDSNTAIIMAVDAPAVILKTSDGGRSWKKVFEDNRTGMFLDAMDFDGNQRGVVIGDPINGRMFKAYTQDAGEHWQIDSSAPLLQEGEAFFASSGSNILWNENQELFVTGGMQSRFFGEGISIPLSKGKNSTGANGMALHPQGSRGVIAGGDFSVPLRRDSSMVLFRLKNKRVSFSYPRKWPSGYKSAVVYVDGKTLIACGTSGVDISKDGGKQWRLISAEPMHVAAVDPSGTIVWLAGGQGRIAKINF